MRCAKRCCGGSTAAKRHSLSAKALRYAKPTPRFPFVLTLPRLPPSHSSFSVSVMYLSPLVVTGTPSRYRTLCTTPAGRL